MVGGKDAGHRIGLFSVWAASTAFCAFVAWGSFSLLSMMMNPALSGADYWAAVRERAQANPAVTAFLVLGSVGMLFGVVLMGRAVIGRPQRNAEPGAAPDTGRM